METPTWKASGKMEMVPHQGLWGINFKPPILRYRTEEAASESGPKYVLTVPFIIKHNL